MDEIDKLLFGKGKIDPILEDYPCEFEDEFDYYKKLEKSENWDDADDGLWDRLLSDDLDDIS